MIEAVKALLASGGWITAILLVVSLLMWFTATLRAFKLRRGFRGSVRRMVRAASAGTLPARARRGLVGRFVMESIETMRRPDACGHDLDRWESHEVDDTESYGAVLQALVAAAPLLGLLGTVSGMVETFASMRGVAMTSAAEQTVASGIAMALVTTQLGLVIGIPGLAVARILKRWEERRRRELAKARALLGELLGVKDHGHHHDLLVSGEHSIGDLP